MSDGINYINDYIKSIQKELAAGNTTEHSFRPVLKTLIESLESGTTATNEPKRIECGAPDFIVKKGPVTNGYIEAKDMGKSLFVQTKPVEPIEYWIYRSKRAYPKGKVELLGIDEVIGDPVIMWTIFLEEGSFIQVQPDRKLTATWAEIKTD